MQVLQQTRRSLVLASLLPRQRCAWVLLTVKRLLSETSVTASQIQAAFIMTLLSPWVCIFWVVLLAYDAMRHLKRTAVREWTGVAKSPSLSDVYRLCPAVLVKLSLDRGVGVSFFP